MPSAIKPFFPTLFHSGRQEKLLHRQPGLDLEIPCDVERIIADTETAIMEQPIAMQGQKTGNQVNDLFYAIDGPESLRFH
jgi:hypothetical protein